MTNFKPIKQIVILILLFALISSITCVSAESLTSNDNSTNIISNSTDNSVSSTNSPNIIYINPGDSINDTVNKAAINSTIILNPGVYNESGVIINKSIPISGNGNSDDVIIDGKKANSIFIINNFSTVYVSNLTFINGWGADFGGGINSQNSSLYVDNCNFINNTAHTINGGGIYSGGEVDLKSYLFVNNSYFCNNYAQTNRIRSTSLIKVIVIFIIVFSP